MEPVAETSSGAVRGQALDGVECYRGIPYAAPPVGARRFRAPEPPEPWEGALDGTRPGPCAPQNPRRSGLVQHSFPPEDEDCLSLNIWTPGTDGRRRPVMAWIHGGSFISGCGAIPATDGSALARTGDVVVVTMNYRLGAFGFLHLDTLDEGADASGNQGLLDQVAALRWIHQEIAAFGGDPTNVTVFGESAGAMCIAALLAMPDTAGLFQKAILQSGATNLFKTPAQAAETSRGLLAELGLSPSQANLLRSMPAAEIIGAQQRSTPAGSELAFGPVCDGIIVPADPLAAIAEGASRGVSVMVGTNEDEMAYFYAADPAVEALNDEDLLTWVQSGLGAGADRASAQAIVETYRAAREQHGKDTSPPALWIAISTDHLFRIPATRLAEAQGTHTPVFMYLLDWKSPALAGRLGASHVIDVPLLFGTVRHPDVAGLELDQPGADDLSAAMQDAWTRFARFGSPATPLLPEWLPYEPGQRWTMQLGAASATVNGPAEAERSAWERALPLQAQAELA